MTLSEALHTLRWVHCSIFIELEPMGKKLQYQPTKSYDELGCTYRKILGKKWLEARVIRIEPTIYNYANIYIYDVRSQKEKDKKDESIFRPYKVSV